MSDFMHPKDNKTSDGSERCDQMEKEVNSEVTRTGTEVSEAETSNKEDNENEEEEEESSSAISEDIAFVKASIVKAAVVTISRDYITVVIM
jgi:hypothetical protein